MSSIGRTGVPPAPAHEGRKLKAGSSIAGSAVPLDLSTHPAVPQGTDASPRLRRGSRAGHRARLHPSLLR